MATAQASTLIQHIKELAAIGAARHRTDRELLGDFVEFGDKGAFADLVERHGPLVLRVCRRVLRHEQDAEDAFQATFLVLARQPASIRRREALASWLYGVAYRTAMRAKRDAARRRKHEGRLRDRTPSATPSPTWGDVQTVLNEEIQRLPESFRLAFVFCVLDGKTVPAAAAELGVKEGTLSWRLARARHRLRRQLAHRDIQLSTLLAGLSLVEGPGKTPVPAALKMATMRLGLSVAAGEPAAAAIPSHVAALAAGVTRAMSLNRVKSTVVYLLMALLLASGGVWAHQVLAAAKDEPKADAKREEDARPRNGSEQARVVVAADPDSDRDGLPDFQEIHKYRTDPKRKDTAGEGVPDGDWQQRREFTYSVRAVLRVMPPYNLKALNDDYQDVRVQKGSKDFVELEVIAYPFNSNAEAIKGNPNWKKDYAGMTEYLAPGITTNWDEGMRNDLLRELSRDGIELDRLTDKEVVEQVSGWLFKHSQNRSMFDTFFVGFREGKPHVLPGLEEAFQREKGDPQWTVQQQFEHELLGKQMFACKTYGTCTSTAVYQTTVLRTLGIPTRMILCIPLADGSDPAQVELIEKGLTNHQVRHDACLGVISGGNSFASHTFCEVFVGGRWRRLNSTTLGQNILERNYLGLMIHVHTFKDLSDANLAATWGTRYARGQRNQVFPHSNPYCLLEVSDHFGKYASLPNPPAADRELRLVTIDRAYWPESRTAPAEIRQLRWGKEPGGGQFFVHCAEWLDNAGDYLQYKLFMRRADTKFVLRAKDRPDVACQITMNFYTDHSRNLCELEVIVPAAEYANMARGVAYTLQPANSNKGYEWKTREGVQLIRE
jgi:RNA polymerase sigma factor (sigma-70 family)